MILWLVGLREDLVAEGKFPAVGAAMSTQGSLENEGFLGYLGEYKSALAGLDQTETIQEEKSDDFYCLAQEEFKFFFVLLVVVLKVIIQVIESVFVETVLWCEFVPPKE